LPALPELDPAEPVVGMVLRLSSPQEAPKPHAAVTKRVPRRYRARRMMVTGT
jgi:hypothetical protein